jgi:CMP/dCMP kinase
MRATMAGKSEARIRTVAISRLRGSGGALVGRAVADRLGLRFVDRQMLRDAAEYLREHDSPVKTASTDTSWWSRISQAFALGAPDPHCAPPMVESVYEGELFEIEQRLLREIVNDEATVIVGRGAAQTLRGLAGVLTVFLQAPEAWRISRVEHVYGFADRRAAQQMVDQSDRARATFIERLGGAAWTDPRAYDLALDTAALGIEGAVNAIIQAAGARVAEDRGTLAP